MFTAKVARTPAGLTQSRPRRGCAFEKVREGGSARASRSDRSASAPPPPSPPPPPPPPPPPGARPGAGRARARLESESSETVGRPPPAGARASPIRRLRRLQRTIEGPAQRPFSLRLLVRPVDHGIERRLCESDATGVPLTRVSSNGATRRTQSGASRASCLAATPRLRFPDETRRRFLATSFPLWRQREIRDVRHHVLDVTDRARAHGHGPVRAEAPRASVRDARVPELDRVRRRREIRAHRERQQRGRGDRAEADQAPTRLRARVASAAPSLRVAPGLVHERALAAAAREGVSERRPPVRDVGRFRASAQPPPLLRVAKRHRRDVAAEERRALETRRRASSCHRETGGCVLSRRALPMASGGGYRSEKRRVAFGCYGFLIDAI